MSKKTVTAISNIAIILPILFIIKYFPNLAIAALGVVLFPLTYLLYREAKDAKIVSQYVSTAHPARLIFVLIPGLLVGLVFWALIGYGVYEFFNSDPLGTTYVDGSSPGRKLPTGHYYNILLAFLQLGIMAITSCILFIVLRGTVIGLRYRFGFAKRPDDYSSPEGAAKAVEALGKLLSDSKFKDVRSEAEPLINTITLYQDLVADDLIEAHLRPHAGWFKRQFEAHVKELRSVSAETPVTTVEYVEHYDDFSNLVAEIRLYPASQNNYFYELLMTDKHPMVWIFALDVLYYTYEEDFAEKPELVQKIISEWQRSDATLKNSSAVFESLTDLISFIILSIKDSEDRKHLDAFFNIGRKLVTEGRHIRSTLPEDHAKLFDECIESLEGDIKGS